MIAYGLAGCFGLLFGAAFGYIVGRLYERRAAIDKAASPSGQREAG